MRRVLERIVGMRFVETKMIYCSGEHVKAVRVDGVWHCTGCGNSVRVVY